jgi:hypothetical protein
MLFRQGECCCAFAHPVVQRWTALHQEEGGVMEHNKRKALILMVDDNEDDCFFIE